MGTTGPNGVNGEFTQVRYSAAEVLPGDFPTNNEGTNSTWGIESTNARWFITRTITFTESNGRVETLWTAGQWRGTDGEDGADGAAGAAGTNAAIVPCLLYTSPSPRDS